MRRELRADVVFGNLEGTLTDASASKCGGPSGGTCFAFRAPPRFARALASAGFTAMNDANNHFGDFGAAGEADTVRALSPRGRLLSGRVDPVRLHGPGRPEPDRSGESLRILRKLSHADFGRAGARLGGRGRILLRNPG